MQIKAKASDSDKHTFDVNTVIFYNGNVYSGADDGKIILWDEHLNKKTEVEAHPCSIYSLAGIGDTIYSCSNEGTVKAWSLDLKEKGILLQDECEFWKLAVSDGVLYCGDDNGIVRTFENDKLKNYFQLLEPVKDMKVRNHTSFVSRDCGIIINTLNPNDNKHSFANRKHIPGGRAPLDLIGDKLVFIDNSARGFYVHEIADDLDYKEVDQIKDAHELIILAVAGISKGDEILVYTGGWDKILKQWKVTDGKCQPVKSCKVDIVINTLCVNENGIVYAAGSDGNIVRLEA